MGISGISEIKMVGVEKAEDERKQTVAEREQSVALTLRSVLAGLDLRAGAAPDERQIARMVGTIRGRSQPLIVPSFFFRRLV